MKVFFKIIYFVSVSIFLFSCAKPPALNQVKPINVKVKAAQKGSISEEFSTAGELKADEDVLVAAQRSGRIVSINVKEGDYVQAGQVLIEISGKDIDADLQKAKADYDTYKKLYDEGAISQIELNSYQAILDRLRSFKNDLVIKAAISGQIGEIKIDKGDFVKEGEPILELVKLYPLELTYTIPERLLAKVKTGQQVIFTTDSHSGVEFFAKVKFISPRVDPQTKATLVRATVEQSDYQLKAYQYVNVRQILNNNDDILLVPEEAVFLEQGQEYIFTAHELEKNNSEDQSEVPSGPGPPPPTHFAKKNLVSLGLRKPGFVQVIEGLEEGDLVVYAGLTSIYDGAKLLLVKEDNDE